MTISDLNWSNAMVGAQRMQNSYWQDMQNSEPVRLRSSKELSAAAQAAVWRLQAKKIRQDAEDEARQLEIAADLLEANDAWLTDEYGEEIT